MKRQNKTITDDAMRIKYETERFFADGAFDLYEDVRFIATLEPQCCEVEVIYGKAVLSCWGDGWARSWRIVACNLMADALQFHCTKQLGQVKCVLEFRRGDISSKASVSGLEFARKIASLIETTFPTIKMKQMFTTRDDSRHLSGVYTRLMLNEQRNPIAAVAIGEVELQTQIDATLSAGLIWLEELRCRGVPVKRLMLFVPKGRAFTIACRLVYVQLEGLTISLFEIDEQQRAITPVTAFAQADLIDNLKGAARQARWSQEKSRSADLARLIDDLNSRVANAIDTQERNGWIDLSIRGLSFARISTRQMKVEFGLQAPRKKLTNENRCEFEALILAIVKNRTADVNSRNHEMFRLQAERWLEALIRSDISTIDPTLDSRFVYSQVPAYRGEQRSFIDLLTATRAGRLVVMELKVSEDGELPFQGLDYWIRIDWHRKRGDFERRGYFRGLKLLDAPPLLYLVAPLFRFHATTKLIAGAISSRVPVYRIGINEDWRSKVRVLLSERLNESG